MGRYDSFLAEIRCPHCSRDTTLEFQTDIGTLRWDTYVVGAVVDHQPAEGEPVGPDLGVDGSRPLWSAGLGSCPMCRCDVRARVELRGGRFAGVVLAPDVELYTWGYLDDGST